MTLLMALSALLVYPTADIQQVASVIGNVLDADKLIPARIRADLANLFKVPVNGEVRVNHQLNKVIARTNHLIDLDNYVQGTSVDASQLVPWLLQQVDNLAAHFEGRPCPCRVA